MRIAIGADHAAFRLKTELKSLLDDLGHEVQDFGTYTEDPVDYPDIAGQVAEAVAGGECERGILVCGTGIGMCIAANKVRGIRAAQCHDTLSARLSREHNDANVLTMGARVIGTGLAREILDIWLATPFAGGRHERRVRKIGGIEMRTGGAGRC
ncbi:MAG: ribose 5-phosphate isomerase B [Firmicutes bacterium]|nr:ribose 5-phosphate isomerase B [Bacillota bacterium]